MTSTLLLCLSFSGWISGERLRELQRSFEVDPTTRLLNRLKATPPRLHLRGLPSGEEMEAFHRRFLEGCRQSRVAVEESIEMFEKSLAKAPELYSLEEVSRLRQQLEGWQSDVQFMKQLERVLEDYEQGRKLNDATATEAYLKRSRTILKEWAASRDLRENVVSVAPLPREKMK